MRLLPIRGRPVVYSPHGFAFERHDLSLLFRSALLAWEAMATRRTRRLVAVGLHEASLAEILGAENITVIGHARSPLVVDRPVSRDRCFQVVVVGRISPQKDPAWVARLVDLLKAAGSNAQVTWIGEIDSSVDGASHQLREELERSGAVCTGWVAREKVLELMASADLYLHSGRWEGFPVTIAEAADMGLPVVARSIPALAAELPVELLVDDEYQAADLVMALAADHEALELVRSRTTAWRAQNLARRAASIQQLYEDLDG